MAVTTSLITAEQYFALPEQPFTQLIDGEIVVNQPTLRHQRVSVELVYLLTAHARANPGLGEACISVDVVMDKHNVFAPDVWWLRGPRLPKDTKRFDGSLPDLVVEVRSPSTWRYDVGTKKSNYERSGLPELWLVDTDADVVLVFRRSTAEAETFDVALEAAGGDTLTTPLIPGFVLDVAELFDR